MIKFDLEDPKSYREACISDKYGIAVYTKMGNQKESWAINVVSIETKPLPDSYFKLPAGWKKITLRELGLKD